MSSKRHISGTFLYQSLVLILCSVLLPASAMAGGLESMGNTDGVLTWNLNTLKPGSSMKKTVIFAYADSRNKLVALLEQARSDLKNLSDSPRITSKTNGTGVVWIRNAATDFALGASGSFFWEGKLQALTCAHGGQLSRFGYYVRYNDDESKFSGTSINKEGILENLRIIQPSRLLGKTQAKAKLETIDKRLQLGIHAMMGNGPVVAVEFVVTNIGEAPLNDMQLSVYSNLESAHSHENDYSVLDGGIGGILAIDPPTGMCTAMVGLTHPATGYSGNWASQNQMRTGVGIAFDQWKPSGNLKFMQERMLRASIPHPPAPYVEPTEPATRTLSPTEAIAAIESDWLFQADNNPTLKRVSNEIFWARQLASRLTRNARTPGLRSELDELEELEKQIVQLQNNGPKARLRQLYFAVRSVKRRITLKNPTLDFSSVIFIDNPYPQGAEWPHQARHRNGMMAVPGGRLLLLDGLHPGGKIRKLSPDKPGSFWRPDLSFDAKKVLFCCKPHDEKSFHLYEINIDGTGLRQLTFGDYDDLDPIYLPDGHIIFSSTRANTYIRCMPYTYCYVLARCDSDGRNIYLISRNNETDWLPALLNDGRVIYSRWEYHDKALWRIQSLWTTNQDGSGTATFWGNQSVWPDHLAEARPIPGSARVMFTGLAHHNWFDGSIGILDTRQGHNFPRGLKKVTCDMPWPECGKPPLDPHESSDYHASGKFTAYKSPYPLSEEDFLVSARSRGKFRLYLMDVYGNRELIYEGAHHIWYAIPVKPRKRPTSQADRVAWPGIGRDRKAPQPGLFYSPDVYQGVPDLPRGKARYLRVIQMDTRTYSSWTRDGRFSGPVVSLIQDDGVKRILGTVPIEADGSVYFKVPSGRTLHFQLLDEHFRALQTMRSFSGVMPGEQRGCLGCHELHSVASPNKAGIALRTEPAELTPPPWGTQSISYTRFVQPVLDKYCGKCHQGDGEARKKLDLTLRPGFRMFKEPYVTLVGGAQYSGVDPKKKGISGAIMAENYDQSDPESYVTLRPMQHLSYTSKLIDIAMRDEYKVDPVSLRKLIAWVDTNCPYRGEEDIRAIPDPNFPGIEYLPVRPRVASAPVVQRP
ncbi:MAG: HzsA-related protein [Planctomycetota bacterium]